MSSRRVTFQTVSQIKPRAMKLSDWRRAKASFIPSDQDFAVTADTVVDDPREPIITPIGILDARGEMLCRVTVPIKVPMGFHRPIEDEEPDTVSTIMPEDMLGVSDCGMGVGYVQPHEVDDEEDVAHLIMAALKHCEGDPDCAKKLLAEQGYDIEFEVKATPDDKAEA